MSTIYRTPRAADARAILAMATWAAIAALGMATASLSATSETPTGSTVSAPSLTLRGEVSTTEGALEGARIELVPADSRYAAGLAQLAGAPQAPVAVTESDAFGRFALEAPSVAVYRVRVTAPRRLPMRYKPVAVVGPRQLPKVVLPPDAGASLRVLTPQGAPWENARVVATSADDTKWQHSAELGWEPAPRHALSDGSGRVVLPRAPAEQLSVTVHADGAVMESWTLEGGDLEPSVVEARPRIEVRETRGGPLGDVLVQVGTAAWPVGRTDVAGRFELPAAWRGPLELHLEAADGRRSTIRLPETAAAAQKPSLVELPRPVSVAGRAVLQSNGRGVAEAVVWPLHDPGRFTRTDAAGRYRVNVPTREPFWFQIESVHQLPQLVQVQERHLATERLPTVALHAPSSAHGRVRDAAGRALSDVTVFALGGAWNERPFVDPDPADSRAVTGAEGTFSLARLRGEHLYTVRASRPGFQTADMELMPTAMQPDAPPLDLMLQPVRSGFGKVLDVDERPIPGAVIFAGAAGLGPLPQRASAVELGSHGEGQRLGVITDEDGRFELPALPASSIDLVAFADGHVPFTVKGIEVPSARGSHDLGTLVLASAVSLRGQVVDLEGEAVAEAQVHLLQGVRSPERLVAPLEQRLSEEPPAAVTDAKGRFRVTELMPGEQVHLMVYHPDYAPRWQRRIDVPVETPLHVVLEPGLSLEGVVHDPSGQSIEGAEILLVQQQLLPGTELPSGPSRRREARSDSDGRFRLSGFQPGQLTLHVTAHGFVQMPSRQLTAVDLGDEPLTIVLHRGQVVEGWVKTTDDEPVSGARLLSQSITARSDAEGFYRLAGLPTGETRVEARHIHFGRQAQQLVVEPGPNTLDFTFTPGHGVTGSVVDPEGEGIADVLVELIYEGRNYRRYRNRTDRDGVFRLSPVVDGQYILRAKRSGFAEAQNEAPVRVEGESVDGLEIVLHKGIRVSGAVRGLEIDALAKVQVRASGPAGRSTSSPVDYQGRYAIDDLGVGVWKLQAVLDGGRRQVQERLRLEPGQEDVQQDLVFEPRLTVSGRVSYDQQPLEGTLVTLDGRRLAVRRSVFTNYLGEFEIEGLEAGNYVLGLANRREHLAHDEVIEVQDDRFLELDLSSAQVQGTVLRASDGSPLTDARVTLRRLGEQGDGSMISIGSGADGTFLIPRAPAGRYRLSAYKDGFAPSEREVQILAGVDLRDVEISLASTEGLDLVLRFADGRVPAYAQLVVSDGGGRRVVAEGRPVDGEGRLRAPTVPPGDWQLLVAAPGAVAQRLAVSVPSEQAMELTLVDAGGLRLLVPELETAGIIAELQLLDAGSRPFEGFDADGTLRRSWPLAGGSAVVEGILPGSWTARVVAPDGRSWVEPVIVQAGATADVTLR